MTELLYHVAPDDSVVSSVVRTRAHRHNILHISGIVFISRSDSKVLLQHRHPSKETFPDRYDCSCAFHVIFGESYEEAAGRELKEEAGISAPLKYLGKFSHHDPPENQIVAVFQCASNEPVNIELNEAIDADFYSAKEIDEIIMSQKVTPWLRDGWKLARDEILRPPLSTLESR